MRKTVFFVDGNFYMHRAWHVINTDGSIERALSALFLSMVCKDAAAVKATHLLVGFDGKSFRYGVYDKYKQSRTDKGKNSSGSEDGDSTKQIYTYLPFLQDYLEKAGVPWVQPKKYEADDVGATLAAMASDDLLVIQGTKDKDGYQTLNKRVRMYNSSAKPNPQFITQLIAEKAKGVPVAQMIDYQTLLGDKIDDIPGFLGFGPAKVKEILNKYGSIRNWYREGSKADKRWLVEHREELVRNRKLVTLVTDCVDIDIDDLKVPKLSGKEHLPKAWHTYQSFLYPKSKGLF